MSKTLIFNVEDLRLTWDDLGDLPRLHRLEVRGDEDDSVPDREWYYSLTRDGSLIYFTVRREPDKKLVGYATVILNQDNQRKGEYCAHQDAVFIQKEYRYGFAGSRLFKYIERECRARGVTRIFQSVTPATDFGPVLERLGYTESTRTFAKYIGGNDHG